MQKQPTINQKIVKMTKYMEKDEKKMLYFLVNK